MRKLRSFLGCVLLMVFILPCSAAHGAGAGSIPVGTTLPSFTLEGPADKADQNYLGLTGSGPFSLSQISGKLVVIDFISVM